MAVIYDNSAIGSQVSNVVSLTFSFTNNSSDALVVGVGGNWPYSSRVSTITYNNVNVTVTANNVESNGTAYAAGYLISPATGANDIVINMVSSTGVTWLNAIAMSVTGATGTPDYKTSFSASSLVATRSVVISSQVNGVVASIALLGGASNGNASWTVDAGSTERIAASYASPWVLKGATKTATYPSTTVTWANVDGVSTVRTSVILLWSFTPRETTLSPTYYYDFQSDTTGYMPNGFTPYANWRWGSTWAVATVPGETTEKALTLTKAYYGTEHAYNNTIGKLVLDNQPVEIAVKLKMQKQSNASTVGVVPGDCLTVGIMTEGSSGYGIGVSFRYGYADEFRIMAYSTDQANDAVAFQTWQISGLLTFDTTSPIVTGAIDPALPYNLNNYDYPNYFTVGQYYQILNLGNTNWNTVANTTGITYKVGDILLVVNVPAYDPACGWAVRKLPTRFLAVGSDGADRGIAVGKKLYKMDGTEIGTIQSIESATSLTLTTNAKTNGTGVNAKTHPDAFVPQTNTWYYIRLRRETTGIYKAKVWPIANDEPDTWLLDSTSEKNGYSHNLVDQAFSNGGRLGVTTFVNGLNYYWAQLGISLDGGVASLDGTFPPTIVSVDVDNTVTSVQTNIAIAGNHLVGITTASIIQNSISIPQTVNVISENTATFDIVFDTNTYDVKYGTGVLQVISLTGKSNKTITITPPDARCYRDLTSVNATADNRLTALPDLAVGDQIEVLSVNGGFISSVNINSDGTFDADALVKSFYCRAWSATDQTWGSPSLQAMVASAIRRRIIIVS
jgi:hypothetical protein